MYSIRKNPYLLISILLITTYLMPYFILGKNFPVLIHDNLDSTLAWYKILLDSGKIFASPSAPIDQVMNGLPRVSLPGALNISLIWFSIFGIYWGYAATKVIIAITGFIGMLFLLRKHVIPGDENRLIQYGTALCFSLLPFWGVSISVAGLPLVLYVFLNLRTGNTNWVNWLIIVVYAFYSSLVAVGVFFLILIGLVTLYDFIKLRKISYYVIAGMVLLSLCYIVSEYMLFIAFFFDSGFLSHRFEFDGILQSFSLAKSLGKMMGMFLKGQYHAHSLHGPFIIIAIVICSVIMIIKKFRYPGFTAIIVFISITSFFYGVWYWEGFLFIKRNLESIFPLNISRFHWLHPLLWYILFAISLSIISSRLKYGKIITSVLMIAQLLWIVGHHEYIQNRNKPTFKEFFAEEQFRDIRNYINKPVESYRVISLGIHPSIAQYNGFYTLDGYFANYPLEYKHRFRRIIVAELEKNSRNKMYFDTWGSRFYFFIHGLDRAKVNNIKTSKLTEAEIAFDIEAFSEMGGKYFLSTVKINNAEKIGLRFLKTFEKDELPWRIHLYSTDL